MGDRGVTSMLDWTDDQSLKFGGKCFVIGVGPTDQGVSPPFRQNITHNSLTVPIRLLFRKPNLARFPIQVLEPIPKSYPSRFGRFDRSETFGYSSIPFE